MHYLATKNNEILLLTVKCMETKDIKIMQIWRDYYCMFSIIGGNYSQLERIVFTRYWRIGAEERRAGFLLCVL